jgi:ubiquinone/menaquinone biosynthesis C-methylase UbiE
MSLFVPQRRFDPTRPEMMDRPDADASALRDDLKNLRTINRLFGGSSSLRRSLKPFLENHPPNIPFTLLDLATGSADLPVVAVRLARTFGREIHVTAVDRNPVMLDVAQELTAGYPEIVVERGEIRALRFSEKSFDVALCSLAIHHFSRNDAVALLRNMRRLSRVGFIVIDLNRSWLAAGTAWLYTHLTTRNPMTLNDSYVSVLRAFTHEELADMAREAGASRFTVVKHPFFRLILTGIVQPES